MTEKQGKHAPLAQVSDKPIVRQMPDAPLATRPVTDIGAIIELAVREGRSADEIEKLVGLFERMQDRQAEAAFNEAFAAFQRDCPAIARDRTADIVTKKGSRFSYRYASLDEIDKVAIPVLNEYGLSRSFSDAIITETSLTIRCILSHIGGHHRDSSFTVPTRTEAGMSEQQKYGSASTFCKRHAFVNVAGLKVCDHDDDGAGGPEVFKAINKEQVQQLEDLIDSTGSNRNKFLYFMGVEKLSDIVEEGYQRALDALERKGRERA